MSIRLQRRATLNSSAAAATYASEVLTDSPLLYWKLDEASGTTAADATGNGRTGTISGTGVTYSQTGATTSGTALLLDGTAGNIKSAATMSPGTNIVTFECWAKFASFNNTDDLLAEYSPNYNSNNGAFLCDPCAAGGNWQIGLRSTSIVARSFTRPSTGAWHHFAFVYDTSTATTRFVAYVDGVSQTLIGSGNVASGNFGTYNLNVGSRNAASLFLAATIDHVAFYAGELSSARVTAHYNALA